MRGTRFVALVVVAAALAATLNSSAASVPPVTLPDLVIEVPTDLISIGVDPNGGGRELRFTHRTADVGSGPFEIDPSYDPNTGISTFVQVIYNSPRPGVWQRDHTVPVAQTGVWHPPSDYEFPMTKFTLNRVNADGSLGQVVATSPKTDYCITGDYRLSGVPNTPDQTSPPQDDCSDPTKPLGWSAGWADQYDQTDAGQPIGLNGVPNGTYILHAVVDPMHVFTESNTSNDVTDTKLQISGDTVTVLSQSTPGTATPTVSLRSPAAGAHVSGQVTLSASAGAPAPETVSSVQFLLDGQPLGGPVVAPPYRYTWSVGRTSLGNHTLSARVNDSGGGVATAAPVQIVVVRAAGVGGLQIRSLRWRRGLLTLAASNIPRGGTLLVELRYRHGRLRFFPASRGHLRVRTPRPSVVVLRLLVSGHQVGRAITAHLGMAPRVRIVNPLAGETVSGTVPLVATASDEIAVSAVQFSVDGRTLGRPVTEAPYVVRWRTSHARAGSHRISAVATDPTGATARTTITVRVSNPRPPMTCFVLQAHLSVRGRGTATTPPFHTAAPGETLLALVSADGPAGGGRQSAGVSGAGLRWRLVKRANGSSGDSEIWAATAGRILRGAQVTSTLADPGFDESLTVVAMEGTAGVGSAAAGSGTSGPAHVALRPTGAVSLVFAAGNDWDHALARALPADWVMLDEWLAAGIGDTFWSQYTNRPIGRAGPEVAVRVTAPTADRWNLAAVELRGEAG